MELIYREMTIGDYEAAYALWMKTEGMVLSSADSREEIEAYLVRNPDCSFICEEEGELLGTILGGHDGRRGFIYHVAVSADQRGRGIGQQLVQLSLGRLREAGIAKCHLFVLEDNEIGARFWARSGWQKREGILLFSKDTT
ncbi:ribosomal protein S18 acetylase RimI-like enzyme [Paenibacillus taihuensis]|uniref:Ribosomal protein S18 acetylase RimI-like enzyme n=1 Tax=Paenibacillus taihuensis TaxID=1156355 RepID=A0A3D9RPJ1_9BACL|nr:GNAT family N-acetyltransferase [Paenibacillus taihuensis]REE78810.1 ribosomal protein S18 acetylase RimI-like enzyme [Paenibacillus taihuensis]